MFLSDFSLNVMAGWIANFLHRKFPGGIEKEEELDENNTQSLQLEVEILNKQTRLFNLYSVGIHLEQVLACIEAPIAHILIEKEPSTRGWNSVCLVLESKVTGEWYVFESGEMAMQGHGGGIRKSKMAMKLLQQSKSSLATWAISKSILDEFEKGSRLWPEVKDLAVPLFSSIGNGEYWNHILEQTREIISASS